MARVVADLLEVVGISHIVNVDLHTPQIEGFFHAPVDSLTAVPTLCRVLRDHVTRDFVVVSPDVGRVAMATHYAEECLGASVVVLHKRRVSGSQTKVTHVVGEVSGPSMSCRGRNGGDWRYRGRRYQSTPRRRRPVRDLGCGHARVICPWGAQQVESPRPARCVVTDAVLVTEKDWPQLRVISIAPLIADAMQRSLANSSLCELQKNAEPASRRRMRYGAGNA